MMHKHVSGHAFVVMHRCIVAGMSQLRQYKVQLWTICDWLCHVSIVIFRGRRCPTINQSINQYIQSPGGQLGPNRQEIQFSEFIQTRFASYMQSIP